MTDTLPRRRSRVKAASWAVLGCLLPLAGCDGNAPSTPGDSRFGQVGVATVTLETPIALGSGTLDQRIVWTSRGEWTLTEEIGYRGLLGDVSERRLQGSPAVSAGVYAQWIAQINDSPGLDLFIPGLDPGLDPDCPVAQSRVTLTIRDEIRSETRSWTRCAPGSLRNLTPTGSGPDPAAARVVNAAVLLRDYTVGSDFLSDYRGSLPFATLDRGQDLGMVLTQPVAFASFEEFDDFRISAGLGTLPEVDFDSEIVFVAAVGVRQEAGDSVEVRRVVPVETGTIVEVVQRVPGNFCSPAAREHVPYHIVVAPRVSAPIRFTEIRVERVPCG